jgi:hypothetical protein
MLIRLIKYRRFGRTDVKPCCPISKLLLTLAGSERGKKSFSPEDIKIIQKLGYEIEYMPEI